MKKETIQKIIDEETFRQNAFGEVRQCIMHDDETEVAKKFLCNLVECKGITPQRMIHVCDCLKNAISSGCMQEKII